MSNRQPSTWNVMGIDQYGQTFHGLGKHPRKELMSRLGYGSAKKMYVDKKDGTMCHIGYIVGPHWVTLYRVEPWEKVDDRFAANLVKSES